MALELNNISRIQSVEISHLRGPCVVNRLCDESNESENKFCRGRSGEMQQLVRLLDHEEKASES